MAATNFPWTLGNMANLRNSNLNIPRFNFKNDGIYNIASGFTTTGGPMAMQGYSSILGDGGKVTIDGGATNGTLFTAAPNSIFADIIVQNNSTGGAIRGFSISNDVLMLRCVANNLRGGGFRATQSRIAFIECEAYACNKSNSAGEAGFFGTTESSFYNCIAHDNTGSNTDGFASTAGSAHVVFSNCISDTNGRHGFSLTSSNTFALPQIFFGCDAYSNGGDGIKMLDTTTGGILVIRNCNFIKNAGWGFNTALTTGNLSGIMDNCGFGSGTQVNGSGNTNNIDNLTISGSVTYGSNLTPWVDPVNGDFRINLPAAKGAGRGAFTETQGSYAGTVAYPDIGAAQHYDTQKSFTFGG